MLVYFYVLKIFKFFLFWHSNNKNKS
jgi:hypothetical protein